MKQTTTTRRKFISGSLACLFALTIVATPTGRSVGAGALVDFIEITERVAHFPYWVVEHSRCFSLDRFDPTCPQCV